MRKFLLGAACALALGIGAAFYAPQSMAQMDVVAERQEAMKAIGGVMRRLGAIAQGQEAFDQAVVAELGNTAAENFAKVAELFPEGSATAESKAKPEIWQDQQAFLDIRAKAEADARALAATTDEASFRAAVGELGGNCRECHERFRQPQS